MTPATFQSTRPRGARRALLVHGHAQHIVSIHAPTRGATSVPCLHQRKVRVSIHAPTRGATSLMISPMVNGCGFNPRAHAGRDARFSVSSTMNALFQSTRPRGARPSARRSISRHGVCFNPRAHAGRDAYKSATVHTHKRFQSTRPRGARQSCHCQGQANFPQCGNSNFPTRLGLLVK